MGPHQSRQNKYHTTPDKTPTPPAPILAPTPLSQLPHTPGPTYHNILTDSNIYNNLEEPNTSSTIPKMDVIYMDYDNLAKIDNANSNMDYDNLAKIDNASKIEDVLGSSKL